MGAKQRIMGACGCGEEKGREVEKTGKESWFKGSAKDVKKAKEAGMVVVSGKCAKTTAPVDCPTVVKTGDEVWFKGCEAKVKAAGLVAPKAADATEVVELEKANPAPVVPAPEVAADAGAAEDAAAKPEDAAKPAEAAPPAEEAAPAAVEPATK